MASALEICKFRAMKTGGQLEEFRRLAKQADDQVKTQLEMIQLEMIERMKRSGLPTAVAEEALRTMMHLRDQIRARVTKAELRRCSAGCCKRGND
jgi:hypothetical protein